MKYGLTLQRRSIAAWRTNNIDYDEIKRFIKKRTTASKGESISVPGRGDDKVQEFESELSEILTQQHERINLFIKSKVGEVRRRLDHAKKLLCQLSSRKPAAADRRIPVAKLERYSRLENDVVKIGDEVRSLARFTNTNRTAFRKLIKKARKWTRSDQLCTAFQTSTLHGDESFLNVDFTPYLDDYSETLATIRNLYESRIKPTSVKSDENADPSNSISSTQGLQAAVKSGSKVHLDTAIATVPLGESGDIANYFVHPDYVIELQVLLLHHVQPHAGRSRQNSLARSSSGNMQNRTPTRSGANEQDYFMLVADNVDRFAKVEGAVTVSEREHAAGVVPQRAKYFMRWTNDEDAVLASRSDSAKIRTASLKRKHADAFFDTGAPRRRGSEVTFASTDLVAVREELSKDLSVQSLYKISSRRNRFSGVTDGPNSITVATLDTNIIITPGSQTKSSDSTVSFPFAVLSVRTEGKGGGDLITTLEESHLVERVRGFSLQYHALWQICRPANISPPFWIPILSRDIRKLPPPAKSRNDSLVPRSSGSGSKQQSTGTNSVRGLTDETTAVETPRPSSGTPAALDQLEAPPLKAFRKKRRRRLAEQNRSPTRQSQRYWSEYDHPEDGEGENSYVIYIDPNERSTLDRLFDSISSLFSPRSQREPGADGSGSATPNDDELSSEDEETALNPRRQRSYGTQPRSSPSALQRETSALPPTTTLCLTASLAILAITFILAATSKHKYFRTVDAAIVFAIICSLVFAGVGFVALMGRRGERKRERSWTVVGAAATVVLADAVGSGALLAWMFAGE